MPSESIDVLLQNSQAMSQKKLDMDRMIAEARTKVKKNYNIKSKKNCLIICIVNVRILILAMDIVFSVNFRRFNFLRKSLGKKLGKIYFCT